MLLGGGAGLVGAPLLPQDVALATLRPLRPFAAGELCAYAGTPSNNSALSALDSSGASQCACNASWLSSCNPVPFWLCDVFSATCKSLCGR